MSTSHTCSFPEVHTPTLTSPVPGVWHPLGPPTRPQSVSLPSGRCAPWPLRHTTRLATSRHGPVSGSHPRHSQHSITQQSRTGSQARLRGLLLLPRSRTCAQDAHSPPQVTPTWTATQIPITQRQPPPMQCHTQRQLETHKHTHGHAGQKVHCARDRRTDWQTDKALVSQPGEGVSVTGGLGSLGGWSWGRGGDLIPTLSPTPCLSLELVSLSVVGLWVHPTPSLAFPPSLSL